MDYVKINDLQQSPSSGASVKKQHMQTPLLATKLLAPPPRVDIVHRPRLIAQLDAATQVPVTIISAPAGFGKTTLVCAWRATGTGKDFSLAWLSLEPSDNNLERFLTYLLAALAELHPGLERNSIIGLPLRQMHSLEVILTPLINDLSDITTPFALVLEDFHYIHDERVLRSIAFLVDHIPPALRLIILTRVDPSLPLARLRAHNQLAEIRAADLRFDRSEASQFLNEVMRLDLSHQEIEALETRTEGWITGLQLAALSLRGYDRPKISEFIRTFSGSNRYILDFLSEEVIKSQPANVQTFMLRTSILDRLSASLCNAVTQSNDSQKYLEQLEQSNLFVTALDQDRQWYRYHHLFADLLRNRLRHSHPEILPELHRRASAWYREDGQFAEAIQHANSVQDYALATSIIEQAANALNMISGWGQVLHWIQSMPDEEVYSRPNLALLNAWGLVLTDQTDQVESLISYVEQYLDDNPKGASSQSWAGQITVIGARLAYLKGEFESAISYSQRATDLIATGELTIRYFLLMTLGLSYVSVGKLSEASQALEKAYQYSVEIGNPVAELEAIGTLAEVQEVQGYLHQAVETYRRILKSAGDRVDLSVLSAHYHLGNVLYEWYQLKQAQHHLEICLSQAEALHHPEAGLLASLWLARVALAQGESDRAAELVLSVEKETAKKAETIVSPYITGFISMLKLSLGVQVEAASSSSKNLSLPQEIPYTSFLYSKLEYLTQVRLMLSLNHITEAESLVNRMFPVAETIGDTGCVIELLALKALVLQRQGQTTSAMMALTQALQRAHSESFIATFVNLGAPMAELLRRAKNQEILPDFVSRLIALIQKQETSTLPEPALIEPLSQRELEILSLVAAGNSNQDIADELVIAIGTVKKHISNIYGKLGVQNRTQCVLRAQELNLL
jgi:LuxR family maltose regulon positive regulatory protein